MPDTKCPRCGGLTEPEGTWCSCGWRAQLGNMAENRNKEHYCEFNDHGQACTLVGHLSQSTNGSGPWYCRQHFARIMGWPQLEAMSMEKPQYRDRLFASLKAKAAE